MGIRGMVKGRLRDKPLWGLRVLKFDGAMAPRVLKFDSGYAAEGCGGRHMDKPCGLEG